MSTSVEDIKAIEEQARQRVAETPELTEHESTIFYDWQNWDEHMRWLVSATVDEIVEWAEQMEL